MPSKSRHTRGKHPHQTKKAKAKLRQEAAAAPKAVVTTPAPVKEAVATAPSQPAGTPARQRSMEYPFITGELRRIAILGGAIIVILIILAVTLP